MQVAAWHQKAGGIGVDRSVFGIRYRRTRKTPAIAGVNTNSKVTELGILPVYRTVSDSGSTYACRHPFELSNSSLQLHNTGTSKESLRTESGTTYYWTKPFVTQILHNIASCSFETHYDYMPNIDAKYEIRFALSTLR